MHFKQVKIPFLLKTFRLSSCFKNVLHSKSGTHSDSVFTLFSPFFRDDMEVAVVYYRVGYVPSHFCCGERVSKLHSLVVFGCFVEICSLYKNQVQVSSRIKYKLLCFVYKSLSKNAHAYIDDLPCWLIQVSL